MINIRNRSLAKRGNGVKQEGNNYGIYLPKCCSGCQDGAMKTRLTILKAYTLPSIWTFQTLESISSSLPMNSINSMSALAVPRNG